MRAQDAERFVARGSEPPARQKPSAVESGCGSGSHHVPIASLPAIGYRRQNKKPSAAESGVWGRQSPPAKRLVARCSAYYFEMQLYTLTRIVCFIALSIHQAERKWAPPQAKPPKQHRDAAAL